MRSAFSTVTYLLSATILLLSCHKDNEPVPAPKPGRLEIVMKPYITGADLDSAVVQTEANGSIKNIRLEVKGDTAWCPIDSVTAGNIKLTLTVYSKKIVAGRRLLWTTNQLTVAIDPKKSLVYQGPASFTDANWLPRLFVRSGSPNLIFIAGLRPSDPCFLIKGINPALIDIEVYKEFFKTKGGIAKVASKSFTCFNNCPLVNNSIEDYSSFAGIPQQIGTKIWDHIEISASFGDGDYRHGWSVIDFNFTVPE